MQTFIMHEIENGPISVCVCSARDLDSARLGKQRVEAKQIYTSLTTGKGWIHHPAVKMWAGYETYLAAYGFIMCQEWKQRGFSDNLSEWFADKAKISNDEGFSRDNWPWWFGHPEMVATHRNKLYHKNSAYYEKYAVPDLNMDLYGLPYLWPTGSNDLRPKGFYISAAEYKKPTDWYCPETWDIDPHTRKVSFCY